MLTVAFGIGAETTAMWFCRHLDMPRCRCHAFCLQNRASSVDVLSAAELFLCCIQTAWVLLRELLDRRLTAMRCKSKSNAKNSMPCFPSAETAACRRVLLLKHFGEESNAAIATTACVRLWFGGTVLFQCSLRVPRRTTFCHRITSQPLLVSERLDTQLTGFEQLSTSASVQVVQSKDARVSPMHPQLPYRFLCSISGIAADRSREERPVSESALLRLVQKRVRARRRHPRL